MTSCCLILLLLISSASAKPQGDWSTLKNFIGQEIAIRTQDGGTRFGVLNFVDDAEIKLQLADDERVSIREEAFKRAQVTRVWRAKLRFGETSTGRGALLGLSVGMGAGYLVAFAQRDKGPPHGLALFPIIGTIVGAKIGASKYKDHKKKKLIYSI